MNEEILNKKIKMEMRMSNQLLKESEELFELYERLFKDDFTKEINFLARKASQITEEEKMESPLDFIKQEKEKEEQIERDKDLYKIYKKIVMKTHPDKVRDESLVDLFDQATQAMNENDWMTILNIALTLEIKTPEFTDELRQKLQANILEIKTKVKSLHNTTAWVWANTAEDNKEKVKKSIRGIMGINEEEFQEFLSSTQK
jgi:isopropylmalate/homocitrate/citramalate synthase